MFPNLQDMAMKIQLKYQESVMQTRFPRSRLVKSNQVYPAEDLTWKQNK